VAYDGIYEGCVEEAVETVVAALLGDHETGVFRDGLWQAVCSVGAAGAVALLTGTSFELAVAGSM
jgi:hypothetical protein